MLDDLKTAGILDSELEGINSLVEQIEGAESAELSDGRARCSMRTSGDISANEICAVHGGGGHFHAMPRAEYRSGRGEENHGRNLREISYCAEA